MLKVFVPHNREPLGSLLAHYRNVLVACMEVGITGSLELEIRLNAALQVLES